MSWSLQAIGTRDKVAESLAYQTANLTKYPCVEPEEGIKQAILAALKLAVAAQDPGCALKISASGSMSYSQPDKDTVIVTSNSLAVAVEPLFVEKKEQ